jgi:hypothetical protein
VVGSGVGGAVVVGPGDIEGADSTVGPAVIVGAGDDVGEQRADLEEEEELPFPLPFPLLVGTAVFVGPAETLGVEGPGVLLLPPLPVPLPLFVGMGVVVGAADKEGSPVGPVLGSEEGTLDMEGPSLGAPLTEGCNDTVGPSEGERERDGAGDSDGAGDAVGEDFFVDFFVDLHEGDLIDLYFFTFVFQTQSFSPEGAGETVGTFPPLPLPIRFQA